MVLAMARRNRSADYTVVNISALDMFANAVGALAFLLLLFAANAIDLARPWSLKILTERLPASQSGAEYIGVLAASGGVAPYTWSLASGSLPAGLTLHPERGEILGTANLAAAGQTFSLEIEVSDTRKKSARARFELRVLPVQKPEATSVQPLVLLTHGDLPDATVGKPYSLYLSARGGSGRYRWSATELPEGFEVEPTTGLLRGTPAAPGMHELILRVEDQRAGPGGPASAVATASLRLLEALAQQASAQFTPPPRILTDILPAAEQDTPYEVRLAGTGVVPLRWSAVNLPSGLRLSDDGVISGTPVTAMESQVVLSLQDARKQRAPDAVVRVTVKPRPFRLADMARGRRLWDWLGYPLLVLLEVAFLYLLRYRMARDVAYTLKLHNVNLIQRADGTYALNGPPEALQVAQQEFHRMQEDQRKYRLTSYGTLAAVMIGYTTFLLR